MLRFAALGAVAVVFGGATFSQAVLTASSSNPNNSFGSSNAFNLSAQMLDPGAYLRLTVSLNATAADGEDGSSITSVTVQRSPAGAGTWTDVCADPSSPYSCSFDSTSVADGLYDLRAVAVNNVGGSATSSVVVNRRVDNTAPTGVTMTDPGSPIAGSPTFSGSASDAGSGVASLTFQASPAGAGTWSNLCTDATSPYSCSFDTTALTDGLYDFRALATDNAGNQGTSSAWTSRRVDNTAPTPVTMTDPGSPIAGSPTFSGSASDAGSGVASLTFQISPAGAGTWSNLCTDTTSPYSCSSDTTTLTDGLYDFRALATDNAGNPSTSSAWTNRRVDNYFPSSTMTDPGAYLRGTVTLGATASDDGGIADVKIQRSPAGLNIWTDVCTDTTSPYSCSFDTTTVLDGLYDFRAVATDNALRSTVSAVVANRRIDNTAPTATMTDPGANLRGTVTLGATAADIGGSGVASVTIQRSPAGLNIWTDVCTDTTSPYSCSFDTTSVADGLYDFRAVALDNAGNGAISALVINRRVDNTAPTGVTMTDPGSPIAGSPTFSGSASDTGSGVASLTFQASPAGAGTWSNLCTDTTSPYSCSYDTSALTDGLYDFRSLATDNAGNQAPSSVWASRTVDNTAPTGTNVQTANASGGTVGKPEQGDTITSTFSEQIAPGTIVSGWNGAGTQTITVTGSNGNRLTITGATVTSSFITLGGSGYFQAGKTVVFANSTISQSGSTLTVTLGAPDKPQWVSTGTAGQSSWPVATTLTDIAGNTIAAGTVLEIQPPNDAEF
jgi:chitinase